ncbi:MAG: acyl-CoA dehydrogenase family protein [Thermodesulfobacteriota bacterium]|nr:acyl-CoA dehydrogenase family protein [Thermodesulfobacteriota bacterium]
MDFGFTKEQKLIKESAKEILERELPTSRVKEIQESETRFSKELWDTIIDAGWLGIVFPEEYGGHGMSLMELAVLYEECGKALMPTVFYSTITGGLAILNGGTEEQKQRILPDLTNGNKLITMAVNESQAIHDFRYIKTRAEMLGGKYYLTGTKLFVQNTETADYLLVAARTSRDMDKYGITLFLVDSKSKGITHERLKTFGLDPQSEVVLDRVEVEPENVIGGLASGKQIVDKTLEQATALQCVEMLGGVQEVLRMTVNHVKQRVQFDRPIGSFQAVQHHLSNVSTNIEGARYTSFQAVYYLCEERPCAKEISMAKAWISDAYKNATLICHQLFGGVGYTLDYDLYLYSNRAKASEIWLGTRDYHLQRLADELGM